MRIMDQTRLLTHGPNQADRFPYWLPGIQGAPSDQSDRLQGQLAWMFYLQGRHDMINNSNTMARPQQVRLCEVGWQAACPDQQAVLLSYDLR